jgi:hypothetical protein
MILGSAGKNQSVLSAWQKFLKPWWCGIIFLLVERGAIPLAAFLISRTPLFAPLTAPADRETAWR